MCDYMHPETLERPWIDSDAVRGKVIIEIRNGVFEHGSELQQYEEKARLAGFLEEAIRIRLARVLLQEAYASLPNHMKGK